MDFFRRTWDQINQFYFMNQTTIKRYMHIAAKVFMLVTTLCAFLGLSALVFFMCEQAMLDFGFTSLLLINSVSVFGAVVAFVAHVATWGKESLGTVDLLLGKQDESNPVKETSKEEKPQKTIYPHTRSQKIWRIVYVLFAILGTCVFSFSSYLGFLSIASAVGATGMALAAMKVFGIVCCTGMTISAGLFCVNSTLKELDEYFNWNNRKKHEAAVKVDPRNIEVTQVTDAQREQYKSVHNHHRLWTRAVSAIFAIGNALGDVIFKSFAFSHWLVLIGLASVAATEAITFSPIGVIAMIVGGISTFALSMTTEGIRIMVVGRDASKELTRKEKARIFKDAYQREPEKPLSALAKASKVGGHILVSLMSFLFAIPTITSSLSKVAGLGALILWFLPGMHTLAFAVSLSLGIFFFVSKFLGYYAQSGFYIIDTIAGQVEERESSAAQVLKQLDSVPCDETSEVPSTSADKSDVEEKIESKDDKGGRDFVPPPADNAALSSLGC